MTPITYARVSPFANPIAWPEGVEVISRSPEAHGLVTYALKGAPFDGRTCVPTFHLCDTGWLLTDWNPQ